MSISTKTISKAHTADFNIEVPKLVFEKIAENIRVTVNADYKPVKK